MIGRTLAVAALLSIGVAHAATVPQPGARDSAIRVAAYHADEVYHVGVVPGEHVEIVFGAGERIVENGVAIGRPEAYSATAAGDTLYLNALAAETMDGSLRLPTAGDAEWSTTLSVRTDRRRYRLRLALVAPGVEGAYPAMQSLVFDFPESRARELAAARNAARREAALAEAQAAVSERLPAADNRRYSHEVGRRSEAIDPIDVFDAGGRTFFHFPGEIPTIYARDPVSGVEMPLRATPAPSAWHVRVVGRTAEVFVLRLGTQVVSIRNDAYRPTIDPAPASGTRIPGVRRVTRTEHRRDGQ